MRASIRSALAFFHSRNFVCRFAAAGARFARRSLLTFGVTLVISLSATGLIFTAGRPAFSGVENTDTRWLPWIGTWRLISDTINETSGNLEGKFLLDIRPAGDGKSIIMRSSQDDEVLLEEKIVVDGSRQPLKDDKCPGWYKYSWSDTGRRLLFESESACPGEMPRFISGISIITENRDWLDIQLMRSGEQQAIIIRKYQAETGDLDSAEKAASRSINIPRYPAGTRISVDEIIELSRKIPPEVLEAALVELRQPFKINSNVLKRLADAEVPPRVVDLMVALSFPDKFMVESHRIAPVPQSDSRRQRTVVIPFHVWLPFGYWSVYNPFSHWYWSSYMHYGYWYPSWDIWPRGYRGGGESNGGRLINGRGYSKVEGNRPYSLPRHAYPRNDSGNSSGGYQNHPRPSSSPAYSSHSGSESSRSRPGSVSSGSFPSASPSASPSGYHSGGNGGHMAKPRE